MNVSNDPEHPVVDLTSVELTLLCEALDSHVYWQLSDCHYRNDGYVREPGSDDAEAAATIRAATALEEKLRAIEREMGKPMSALVSSPSADYRRTIEAISSEAAANNGSTSMS